MKTVLLVVTIDTECDKNANWGIQRPLGFSSVSRGIPEQLLPLFERHKIIPTFLLSPEVMQDEASVEVLSSIQNCELGTHLHGEFIPPQEFPEADRSDMPQFTYPPQVEHQKLTNLTQLFETRFGYRPLAFRAGRFALSKHTLRFLSDLGYEVDTSVTPFRKHSYENDLSIDYWGAGVVPYYPSAEELRKPGDLDILEVPVSSFIPALLRFPAWLLRKTDAHRYWYKKMLRGDDNFKALHWVRPFRAPPEGLIQAADFLITHWEKNTPPVLNVMFHSVEATAGTSPYAQTEQEVGQLISSLDQLFSYLFIHYQVKACGLSPLRQFFPPNR